MNTEQARLIRKEVQEFEDCGGVMTEDNVTWAVMIREKIEMLQEILDQLETGKITIKEFRRPIEDSVFEKVKICG